jgi:HNH endonuclease
LHPIVYFYSQDGRHKVASFYAAVALVMDFEKDNYFNNFTKTRADFELILLESDYLVQQIVRRYRSAIDSYKHIKQYYQKITDTLLQGVEKDFVIKKIIASQEFNYLTIQPQKTNNITTKEFSRETKSATFIKEALLSAPKCKICGGYLHSNSISIDHIQRKVDGGLGTLDNAQLTHPYCNTTFKN